MVGTSHLIRKLKLLYSSSPQIRQLIKKITQSNFYFWMMKKKIARQKERDKKGPFNLIIETSNFCNARCLMCPYKSMQRTKKIMNQRIFNKIIKRIKEEKLPINKVFFSGMGEPLIDGKLMERIAAIKKLGLAVRLYTNASLLTAKISRRLVELKVDEINISFNGATPKEYQEIMGLNFKQTVANINTLLKIKKENHSAKPIIQISSIVIKRNERNIKKHIQNWQNKVDSVTVSLAHKWGGGVDIDSQFQTTKPKRVYPCRSLWHTFVIDSGGNFVLCCRDYESKHILGNIMVNSFADIQKNEVLKKIRERHLQYSWKKLPKMCQQCNFPYQDGVEWLMPRSLD